MRKRTNVGGWHKGKLKQKKAALKPAEKTRMAAPKSLGETLSILLPVVLLSVVLYITSTLFVPDECRNFFPVAHFGAAIRVFSGHFGAAFYYFNFALCSTSYVRPLSHLSLFCILRCHLFFFIKSCAFLYYLSFLLPDEASGWNVVHSTAFCSTVCYFFLQLGVRLL